MRNHLQSESVVEDVSKTGATRTGISSSRSSVVADQVDVLIEHYRQSVHHPPEFAETTKLNDATASSTPPPPPPPMMQYLLDRILEARPEDQGPDAQSLCAATTTTTVLVDLIALYSTKIRPLLFLPSPPRQPPPPQPISAVAVLMQYERLVTLYLQSNAWSTASQLPRRRGVDTIDDDDDDTWSRLNETLAHLAGDVTAVQQQPPPPPPPETRADEQQPPHVNDVPRTVRRFLLRLFHHTLVAAHAGRPWLDRRSIRATSTATTLDGNVLRRCVCSLLGVEPLLQYTDMNKSLEDCFWHHHGSSRYHYYHPPAVANDGLPARKTLWEWVGLRPLPDENTTNNDSDGVPHIAAFIWTQLETLVLGDEDGTKSVSTSEPLAVVVSSTTTARESSTNDDDEHDNDDASKERRRKVLEGLDMECMAKAVRAHFFGRDDLPGDGAVVQPRLHLGHTILDSSPCLPQAQAHQVNPSRLHSTLHFLSLLTNTVHPKYDVIIVQDEVLPVIYDLLNSSSDDHVRWGAVSLFHWLQLRPTTVDGAYDVSFTPTVRLPAVVVDNLASMLHKAVQIHRTGSTLAVLGAAQRELFRRATATGSLNEDHRRRTVTALQQWLLILDRNSRHYTKDYLVWGLLVGGIVPLLYDCAVAACSGDNAEACVEIGRLGLSALLPVIRGEAALDGGIDSTHNSVFAGNNNDIDEWKVCDTGREVAVSAFVQMAALTALSNLLVAAHPIMPRHAGKIVCELVALLRRLSTVDHVAPSSPQRLAVRKLALHTAGIAVVICGDPALVILDHIASGSVEYDDGVLDTVETIRAQAVLMQNQ